MFTRRSLSMVTALLLLVVGIGAVVSGVMLILEPDGTTLNLSLDLLQDSPFNDYFIPGIILLAVNGFLGLIGSFLAFRDHRFSGWAAMILGAALVIWIGAEVYWFGWENWLMPTFMAAGVIEMVLGFLIEADHHENWKWFGGHHHHPLS